MFPIILLHFPSVCSSTLSLFLSLQGFYLEGILYSSGYLAIAFYWTSWNLTCSYMSSACYFTPRHQVVLWLGRVYSFLNSPWKTLEASFNWKLHWNSSQMMIFLRRGSVGNSLSWIVSQLRWLTTHYLDVHYILRQAKKYDLPLLLPFSFILSSPLRRLFARYAWWLTRRVT